MTKPGKEVQAKTIGPDVGNGYTKCRKIKFASRVTVGKRAKAQKKVKNTYDVNFDGQEYVVGIGSEFTGENRYFTTNYKLCLLTSIALNYPKEDFIDVTACVGLPVEKYERISDKLVEEYEGKQYIITVNERKVTVRFNEFIAFIEGAYPIYSKDDERIITIDMGAGTINVTQFYEREVEKFATYSDSMYDLYQEICTYLNTYKGGDFLPSDIEPLLNKTKTIIDGVETDISDIKPMIASHISSIASRITNAFSVGRSKMYLIGGGCMDTVSYWKENFPKAIPVEDGQNINSKVYELVALDSVVGDEEVEG